MTPPRVALLWERFGPYHNARMAAAAAHLDLTGVEVVALDATYSWNEVAPKAGYEMKRLDGAPVAEVLDAIAPAVVAVPGWEAPYALGAITWARSHGARVVLMSDSNFHDAPRSWLKEWVKRGVVTHAQAGFAAGRTAAAYLARLGLEPDKITTGYDVVDNAHFARSSSTPPGHGFLAVARFVEKKNLGLLLDVYAAYHAQAGAEAWPLTIAGDGHLRPVLEERVARLGLLEAVNLTGFVQYSSLPALYHGAGALVLSSSVEQWGLVVNEAMAAGLPVLVSNVAGCAPDLVVEGRTGFTFSPTDKAGLMTLMIELTSNPARAATMGEAAIAHIADWGPDAFAEGLAQAVQTALAAPVHNGPALRLWTLRQQRRE